MKTGSAILRKGIFNMRIRKTRDGGRRSQMEQRGRARERVEERIRNNAHWFSEKEGGPVRIGGNKGLIWGSGL